MVPAPTPLSRCSNLLLEALPSLRQRAAAAAPGNVAHDNSGSFTEALRSVEEASTIAKGLDDYIHETSTALIVPSSHPIPAAQVQAVWGDLIQQTHDHDWQRTWAEKQTTFLLNSGMCSGTYEATVLQQFALMSKASRVLEIGMFTGTTTVGLLDTLVL
jgi:caffeoyl-CoA O-methyltransferase